MIKPKRIIFGLSMSLLVSLPVHAQNADATPTYGEINLGPGAFSDPYDIHLQAGGPVHVDKDIGASCVGYIASAPDLIVQYQSSGLPLHVFVESQSDTTLLIQGPDQSWHCDDDTNGLNPSLVLPNPQSGRYTIWVGTYRNNGTERAVLNLAEGEAD